MAFEPLVPVNMNFTMIQGLGQAFTATSAVNSPSGTAINLSTFFSLSAEISSPTPGPNTAPVSFGTVTGTSSGILTITQSDTDLANVAPGVGFLRVFGKPLTGDSNQLLATGTITLQAQ